MKSLETNRLTLRQFRESDLDEYAAICADPQAMRFLSGKPLLSYAEFCVRADVFRSRNSFPTRISYPGADCAESLEL